MTLQCHSSVLSVNWQIKKTISFMYMLNVNMVKTFKEEEEGHTL